MTGTKNTTHNSVTKMYYLDSNVFIYPALYEGEKAKKAQKLLKKIVKGKEKAATSALTMDEVLWILWQNSTRKKAIKEVEDLLQFPNLKILDVKSENLIKVLSLMKQNKNLKPRDSIHLATMLNHGIYTIITDKENFNQVKDIDKIGLKELNLQ